MFNSVLFPEASGAGVPEWVGDILRRFSSTSLWLLDEENGPFVTTLESLGFSLQEKVAGMAREIVTESHEALPLALEIKPVQSDEQLEEWASIQKQSFEFDDQTATCWHELFTNIGFADKDTYQHAILYDGGRPIGAYSLLVKNGVAALSNLGVLPLFRGRGAGGRLVKHAISHAKDQGCHTMTLVSSSMGTQLYLRNHFQTVWIGCMLLAPASAELP